MATTKKPGASDEAPQPARPAGKSTASAAEAEPEMTAEPKPEAKRDRTLLIAASFLAAVALFAAGFGIGHAVGDDDSPVIIGGNQFPGGPGLVPFGDGNRPGGRPDQRGGGGYLPGPGSGNDDGGDTTLPMTDQALLGIAGFDAIPGGVRVTEVQAGSGAEAAGLMIGDRIVSVDGASIRGMRHLSHLIGSARPGDTISIGVDRAGESLTLTATLGSRG